MSKYSPKIDLSNMNSSQTRIISLVRNNKKVIEFGCAAGHMSKVLKEQYLCEIVGLEINKEDAEKAAIYCKEVIVGDIESFDWCEKLSGSSFDVAIFADVLEHLKDPKTVLAKVKSFLNENGYILVSVPNIANISIRLELLLGSFEYEELGILDDTHLKYYTLKSLIRMIEDAGFYVDSLDYTLKDLPISIIKDTLKVLDLTPTKKTIDELSGIESLAYQFIVKALNRKPNEYIHYVFKEIKKPEKIAEEIFQEHVKQLEQADKWLREKDCLIREQSQQIQKIETELNLVKHSTVWRIAEFFSPLVYIRLFGKFPLLQKAALTWSREGSGVLYVKTKKKGRDFYVQKSQELRDHLKFLQLFITLFKRNWKKIFSKEALSINKWRSWIFKLRNEFKKVASLKGDQKIVNNARKIGIYESYIKNNEIHPHVRKLLTHAANQFKYKPLISIIMPVYNVEPRWLGPAVDSVRKQIYTNWELCIADDASTDKATIEFLKSYENIDERMRMVYRTKNGHICAASNSAADLAQGEFVAFMDNDDLLAPNALFEIVRVLQENPGYELIYSDEDKIDENDKRYDPQFKPDWSPELFLSYNYINHFTCIRRALFETSGCFRIGYEGAQDYDLLLRVIEKTDKIRHIPKVLYHWRAIKGSVALDARDKPIMNISALNGLKDHLKRVNIQATTYQQDFASSMGLPIYQLDWPDNGPSVSIIIPTFNQEKLLKRCIESIVNRTTYLNYEIMVVDNDSNDEATLDYLRNLIRKGIKVERIGNEGQSFSFSRINNLAAGRAESTYILFLNNDVEILEPKWLSRLAGYLSLPGVGVTGAKLIYPNRTLQHAGVVLGMHDGIIPDHAFINHPQEAISYYFMAEVARNCSAVTGACLMTRRSDFIRSGGFNEQDLKVSLQDVDYCLRLNKQKLRTVYVAGAELVHHQSMSRPREDDPRELAYLRKTYTANGDPYYNINLSQINSFAPDNGCSLFDYSEFIQSPLKVMIFTHNFELAGAPKAMYDLAVGLKNAAAGKITVEIVSPTPGPFQSFFECAGIKCRIIDIQTQNIGAGWKTKIDYDAAIKTVQDLFASENPDVLITNTIFGFYVLHAARPHNFPVIWIISESFDHVEFQRSFNYFTLPECVAAFAQAYSVVFGSQGTRNYYEHLNSQHNFQVIHNSVDRMAIDQFREKISKEEARNYLGIQADKKILLMVGTICERKGQGTLAEAVAQLRKTRKDFQCYLVGANEQIAGPYLKKIYNIIKENHLHDTLKVVPEVKELYWYYRASDIFVFTSRSECYPLSTLEAMAFGLPIVTTPCCGVTEQVRSVNALFFAPSDSRALAKQINVLLNNENQMIWLGRNSKAIAEYQQTYQEMIEKYKRLVFGAWIKGNNPE